MGTDGIASGETIPRGATAVYIAGHAPRVLLMNPGWSRLVRCVVAALTALAPAVCAALDYAGIGPTTDPVSLRELFPASRHEFWQRGTGSVVLPADDPARFETLLEEGDGRYVVRLAADDTRAEMTSVSMSIEAGKVRLVTLGFERGGDGDHPEQVERHYPGCRGVLDALNEKFGRQPTLTTRVEEYLEHRVRTWTSAEGSVRLDCGRFVNRRPIFAMDLEFDTAPEAVVPKAVARPVHAPVAAPAPKPKSAAVVAPVARPKTAVPVAPGKVVPKR